MNYSGVAWTNEQPWGRFLLAEESVKLTKTQLKVKNWCPPSHFPKPSIGIRVFAVPILTPKPYVWNQKSGFRTLYEGCQTSDATNYNRILLSTIYCSTATVYHLWYSTKYCTRLNVHQHDLHYMLKVPGL